MATSPNEFESRRNQRLRETTLQLVDESAGAEDPSYLSAAYLRMERLWQKCRAVFAGTDAIRAAGDDVLPQFDGEPDEAYDVRVRLVAFYNAFARTVRASVGMLLQQEPVLGDDMSPELVALWENVDGAGTHGAVFTRNLAMTGIIDGLAGIFVTKQRVDNPAGVDSDAERRLGLRPYWILVRADDIIKPFYETRNGAKVLTLFIRREIASERIGSFGVRGVIQYRVYERSPTDVITSQLWKLTSVGGTPIKQGDPVTMAGLKEIPWSPLVAGEQLNGVGEEIKPPLLDLADLNINHHQQNTNIQSLESLAMVPTPVRIGAPKGDDGTYPPFVLGPRSVIEAPNIQGVPQPVYWLSPNVEVLAPSMKTLEQLEQSMAREGGAFLAPDPNGVESAEAKRIKQEAQRATLATVARAVEDCLEYAFQHTAAFLGQPTAGTVTVNKDFESPILEPTAMAVYVDACDRVGLDPVILIDAWQRGGRIPDDRPAEDIAQDMRLRITAKKAAAEAARAALMQTQPDPGIGGGDQGGGQADGGVA